jgi:hypothetical protein
MLRAFIVIGITRSFPKKILAQSVTQVTQFADGTQIHELSVICITAWRGVPS